MRLELYRTLWGLVDDLSKAGDVLPAVKAAGYDGASTLPLLLPDAARFRDQLAEHALQFVPVVFTFGKSVDDHVDWLRRGIQGAKPFAPRLILAHSGRDSFSDAQAIEYFARALAVEADEGIPVAHETHRGRILYNPWTTLRLLDRFDQLKLNCDFSHWCCVAERLLDHETDIIARCAERALHIDARVGHEEGPQVADPRAPELQRHLEAHERWWSMVWDAQAARGLPVTSMTPEFGPPPYQPTLPHTNEPVGDIGAINDWMAARQRARFAAR